MVLWVVAYQQLSPMSSEFFQPSRAGVRGLTLYLTGHYGDAARAYRAARRGPVKVEYRYDQAGAYALLAGDLALAERRARTTLLFVPEAVEPLVTLGEIALEGGKPEEALARFAAVLARQPEHADALYLSAVALARAARYGPAIDQMNDGLRGGSVGNRETTFLRVLELTGDLAERPAAQQPLCLLAHLYRYLRVFDPSNAAPALAYSDRAIAARDRPADAYLTLAVVRDKLGEHAEALQAAQMAIGTDPKHAQAFMWAAVEAWHRNDLLLEYRMTRAAFEAAPTDPFYATRLHRLVLVRLGDPYAMAVFMEQAVARDPRNAAAHEYLAQSARVLGDRARFETHARIAAELRRAGGGAAADEDGEP